MNLKRNKSLLELLKSNRKILIISILLTTLVGSYFLITQAAPNNCTPVPGGGICDMDQASYGDDSVISWSSEPFDLHAKYGWWYWGTAFRAPNFPLDGSQALYRVNYVPLSMHGMYLHPEMQNLVNNGATLENGGAPMAFVWSYQAPNTVPVYRLERDFPHTVNLYSTDNDQINKILSGDPKFKNKGIAFYAYPPNYTPPPPPNTPAPVIVQKNDNCENQSLKKDDQGECVKWLKGILIGLGFTNNIDKTNGTFDQKMDDYIKLAIVAGVQQGKFKESYTGVVSPTIWRQLSDELTAKLNPSATPVKIPNTKPTTAPAPVAKNDDKTANVDANKCNNLPEAEKTNCFYASVQAAIDKGDIPEDPSKNICKTGRKAVKEGGLIKTWRCVDSVTPTSPTTVTASTTTSSTSKIAVCDGLTGQSKTACVKDQTSGGGYKSPAPTQTPTKEVQGPSNTTPSAPSDIWAINVDSDKRHPLLLLNASCSVKINISKKTWRYGAALNDILCTDFVTKRPLTRKEMQLRADIGNNPDELKRQITKALNQEFKTTSFKYQAL